MFQLHAECAQGALADAGLSKNDIDERAVSQLSPMPHGLVKTPTELRDLLAYLLSERPMPP